MFFTLSTFEYTALFKLLLAAICGGVIGIEREMKGRPAGLKTFSLVCLGATLVMITNDYIYTYISHGTGDSARMAAQVISGIGFLGAGFYFGGLAGVCIIYFVSSICRKLDHIILKKSRFMKVYVEGINEEFMLHLVNYLTTNNIKVLSLQRKEEDKWYSADTCASIELDFGKRISHKLFLDTIKKMDDFRYIEEI